MAAPAKSVDKLTIRLINYNIDINMMMIKRKKPTEFVTEMAMKARNLCEKDNNMIT